MKVKASARSVEASSSRAQDFVYLAKEDGFEKAAETSSSQIRETAEFVEGSVIPGLGMNEEVMAFAFGKNLDAMSEPMSVTGGVAVFKISGVRAEGVRPFDEVKPMLRVYVLREKKLEAIKTQVDSFAKGLGPNADLQSAAKGVPQVSAARTGAFKVQDAPTGIGRDYAFVGHVATLKPGEISKPFQGTRGYFVAKLLAKSAFDSTQYAVEKNTLRDQILGEKRNRLFSDWLAALREKATIEDLRSEYYR